MALINIKCDDALHASRSAEPDWRDVVAKGTKHTGGMICPACARLREVDSSDDHTDGRNSLTLFENGDYIYSWVKTYPGGEVVASLQSKGKLQDLLTPKQLGDLKTLGDKIKGLT